MKDAIAEIGIDTEQRLYVKPTEATFPYIYRESMEVHWDAERVYLRGPPPRKWSYFIWFQQILKAVNEQGCQLYIKSDTAWVNVPSDVREAIDGQGPASACGTKRK
jgi:hypothetical protein